MSVLKRIFRGIDSTNSYRVYFATDFHGSEQCWRKFIKAGSFYNADLVVMGGDISGKVLIPIVRQSNDQYEATLFNQRQVIRGDAELEEFERRVRFNGFYPHVCTPEERDELSASPDKLTATFSKEMIASLANWIEMADTLLEREGRRCIIIPGNDDEWVLDEVLSSGKHVINGDRRVIDVGPYQVGSLGLSNPTPWDSPREVDEATIEKALRELVDKLDKNKATILNIHVPPYSSTLDEAPEVTEDLEVVSAGGERPTVPVGSEAVRKIIEELQPVLTLHGHVHESRAATTIGRTLAINPGSRYNEGMLQGALVELQDDQVVRHQFVSG